MVTMEKGSTRCHLGMGLSYLKYGKCRADKPGYSQMREGGI